MTLKEVCAGSAEARRKELGFDSMRREWQTGNAAVAFRPAQGMARRRSVLISGVVMPHLQSVAG